MVISYLDFEEGSGELRSNDLTYNPVIDKIFWAAVDPTAGMYNLHFSWFEGDITNTEDFFFMGVSGQGATDHYEASCTWAHEWALTPYICDEPDYNLYQNPGLGYWDYDFEHPAKMGGFYYDGGMILTPSVCSN